MTRLMYDGITPAKLPKGADFYASYIDGEWPNYPQLSALFPRAKYLSIATTANDNADVLDVERYDATPAQAPAWVLRQRKRHIAPIVYMAASIWPTVKAAFYAQNVPPPYYWVANYNNSSSIPDGAIAHQWRNTAGYDESSVANFIPGIDSPVIIPRKKESEMIIVAVDQKTVPKGTPWPGDFLLDNNTLTHIVTPEDYANLSKALGAPVVISYQQYLALNKVG